MKLTETIKKHANPKKAISLQKYFKTGKGEYGEGDIFVGLTVPVARSIAKQYAHLTLKELQKHMRSKIHEERLITLMILCNQFAKTKSKDTIDFYLKNTKYINNWDLVDTSARDLLGEYLKEKDKKILYTLAESKNLWERRIAIIATHAFINNKDYKHTKEICKRLLKDDHDLIHKATGWMLREMGKKEEKELIEFLEKHCIIMPRTMLRYSIERLTQEQKKKYMSLPH